MVLLYVFATHMNGMVLALLALLVCVSTLARRDSLWLFQHFSILVPALQ